MNVKIRKLHPDAVVPRYATVGSAGFDFVAVEDVIIAPGKTVKVPLGLAFEIPPGFALLVCMRSGIALKTKLRQPNGIGIIDSDYRGEVAMMFDNIAEEPVFTDAYPWKIDGTVDQMYEGGGEQYNTYLIRKGDRVAQGMIVPFATAYFTVVDELGETERGAGGFGSTGTEVRV